MHKNKVSTLTILRHLNDLICYWIAIKNNVCALINLEQPNTQNPISNCLPKQRLDTENLRQSNTIHPISNSQLSFKVWTLRYKKEDSWAPSPSLNIAKTKSPISNSEFSFKVWTLHTKERTAKHPLRFWIPNKKKKIIEHSHLEIAKNQMFNFKF